PHRPHQVLRLPPLLLQPPRAPTRTLQLRVLSSLAPPRASGDEAPENSAVAVHHPDTLVAETGDEDAAEVLAAAPLADEAVGGVPVDVALGEDGEAGVAEGGGELEDCGGSAAGEGDAGVAGCEAGVGGGGGVATDVGHGVGGDAHLAGSVVLNVSNLLKALKVLKVSKVLLC
ncbi:hypothetical protein V500_09229, partial [Pseudogymnoascus sp. VKM F-4518 (FW-2643)]